MQRRGPDAADISRMLASRIQALVQELLPGGKKEGQEWRCGSVSGEPGGSLSVRLTGSRAGIWADFASPLRGDALDLVAHSQCHGSLADARRWALSWLGISDAHSAHNAHARAQHAHADTVRVDPRKEADGRIARAHAIWEQSSPSEYTVVDDYFEFRGLKDWPWSIHAVLRFNPECPACDGSIRPAMVAKMTDPVTGEFNGVHRTFLRPGGLGKAEMAEPKQMLGLAGVVRLHETKRDLCVAEGIESAMAAMLRAGTPGMLACLTAGAISRLPVLDYDTITIYADADDAGVKAAEACVKRWRDTGRPAEIVFPPNG